MEVISIHELIRYCITKRADGDMGLSTLLSIRFMKTRQARLYETSMANVDVFFT
jgi:hypothetical protein